MTSSAPPSGAARAAGIILRVILNRISYQMLSLWGNRIKFYNKINKVLVITTSNCVGMLAILHSVMIHVRMLASSNFFCFLLFALDLVVTFKEP
jgi:hypothetical protein